MKIRMGFVSNSSSSSFIIAYNDADFKKECPHCHRANSDIEDMILGNYSCSLIDINDEIIRLTDNIASTKKQLEFDEKQDPNSKSEWGSKYSDVAKWDKADLERDTKVLEKIESALCDGKRVFMARLDNHSSHSIQAEIYKLAKQKELEIIDNYEA